MLFNKTVISKRRVTSVTNDTQLEGRRVYLHGKEADKEYSSDVEILPWIKVSVPLLHTDTLYA